MIFDDVDDLLGLRLRCDPTDELAGHGVLHGHQLIERAHDVGPTGNLLASVISETLRIQIFAGVEAETASILSMGLRPA
jgi:hypothetical protein